MKLFFKHRVFFLLEMLKYLTLNSARNQINFGIIWLMQAVSQQLHLCKDERRSLREIKYYKKPELLLCKLSYIIQVFILFNEASNLTNSMYFFTR
ncbi:hypothetical protein B7486_36415 [cyanobacterium TDX16]|nr:hypothetical protein B7486_36415 [cyanobacterium TDX16]